MHKKILHLVKKALFQALFKSKFISRPIYDFWNFHATLHKKILQLVS